ncbi:MAG: hypothetical protein ACYS29_00130 [Planctomycetota bacterium]
MAEENPDLNVHEYKLRNHEERLDKIDLILEKVRNRLYIWCFAARNRMVD